MNIQDLAKDLDQLARALRSATDEARTEIISRLDLERLANSCDGGGKYRPKKLTLEAITNAIAGAQRQSGRRAQNLRSDVYDRRVKKLSRQYSASLEHAIRCGNRTLPSGVRFNLESRNEIPGIKSIFAVMPGWFRRSPVDAEISGWIHACEYVLQRVVPAYSYDALRREAKDNWAALDDLVSRVRQWVICNVSVFCNVDNKGIPTSVGGVDPVPFLKVLENLGKGDADPAGIIRAAHVKDFRGAITNA